MEIQKETIIEAKNSIKALFGMFNDEINNKIDKMQISLAEPGKSSHFDYDKNVVYINGRYANDVNHFVHEILHALSTKYVLGRTNIGFNKKYYKKYKNGFLEVSYGYAINEGATHALTRNATKGKFGPIEPLTNYDFSANVYQNIEKLLSPSIAHLLYYHASVNELVQTTAKVCHTNEENVLKLILNLDTYFDTFRIYNYFMEQPQAEDVKSLLTNAYTYLAKIMSDKAKAEGKSFNFFENISTKHLSKDELKLFAEIGSKVDVNNAKSNADYTIKQYEKMAVYLMALQDEKQLKDFDFVPAPLKTGEFYNFLLLSNYYCDENKIREDIKSADAKASLTRKIFDENRHAFNLDEDLPENIRTLLSSRYAVRAGVATSDYYMMKSLGNEKFDYYLKNSDSDYYEALKECAESMEMEQKL